MTEFNNMRNTGNNRSTCNCNHCSNNDTIQCPTLRMGNRGSAVAFVQRLLRQRGYNVPVDGIFGNMTRNAVTNFQRRNNLSQTGQVDDGTWRALGVTCLPGQYYPGNDGSIGSIIDTPQTLPSFPSTPAYPGNSGSIGSIDTPQILPSFPDTPVWQENELDGLNYTWEEVGNYRYILTTNKARYAQGETVYITFRKRNISDNTQVLRYPSDELFDFYISDRNGIEVYRLSRNVVDSGIPHEIVLTPGQAETTDFQWNQVTNTGQWVAPQQLTLWGVNTAVGVSVPLPFSIY